MADSVHVARDWPVRRWRPPAQTLDFTVFSSTVDGFVGASTRPDGVQTASTVSPRADGL
jgi:hypothetical protein